MRFASLLLPASLAFLVSWVTVWLVRLNAHQLGLVDLPNDRSSHRLPTARGGGLGIVAGTLVGTIAIWASGGESQMAAILVLAAATGIAIVGLVDDVRGLSPQTRLAAQLTAAMVVLFATGPMQAMPLPYPLGVRFPLPVLGWMFACLWLVTATNFFNFMDGIDGLAGGQAVASCVGIVAASWGPEASWLACFVGAASLGFLVHNWPPAKVFMGDAGSGFLGFLLAALPFLAPDERRAEAVLAVGIGMTLFLLDPLVTLFKRARARKQLTQAHREHLYQQLVAPGEPAGRITCGLVSAALLLAVAGAAGYRAPRVMWVGAVASVGMFLSEWALALRRKQQREAAEQLKQG